MDRRSLIAGGLGIFAIALNAGAQRASTVARIGVLVMGRNHELESSFLSGLAELDYREGRDIVIEWRSAMGRTDQLATLARTLVQLPVDAIIAGGPEPLIAAMQATEAIPIIVVGGSDPMAEGWATSLSQPGGNVTGLTVAHPELLAKKLQLLSELIPNLSRVAIIGDPVAMSPSYLTAETISMQAAARSLRLDVMVLNVHHRADIAAAVHQASAVIR